jgi:hypothetical protein
MKRFRLLLVGAFGLLTLGLGSCLKAPEYPVTPEISYESIRLKHDVSTSQPIDSVFITIRFQDGDGDLGMSSDESNAAPYVGTRFANNYFIEPYVRASTGGSFVDVKDTGRGISAGAYNSRFERISTSSESRSAPIKGTLTRVYTFAYRTLFQPGEEVRFTVSIADRAMHESNTITTESVVFPK